MSMPRIPTRWRMTTAMPNQGGASQALMVRLTAFLVRDRDGWRAGRCLHPEVDQVRIDSLCPKDSADVIHSGVGPSPGEPQVPII